MEELEKEFVLYQESLELKKLGFDKPCFGYYNTSWNKEDELLFPQYAGELENWNNTQHLCSAPTFSQAFRWFREKYGLYAFISKNAYMVEGELNNEFLRSTKLLLKSYEEAELACIRKLIEIVKNNG